MQSGSRFRQAILHGAVSGAGPKSFLQPCRGFAGRSGQDDAEFLAAWFAYQALENSQDGGGFAGARPSGDDDKTSGERGFDRQVLKISVRCQSSGGKAGRFPDNGSGFL